MNSTASGQRSLPLIAFLPLLLPLSGCSTTTVDDYFQFAVDNSWEFRVIEGESENDERWSLKLLEADDNPDTGRGDFFFSMTREFDGSAISMRAFNIAVAEELDGATSYVYKWANNDEGVRNKDFIEVPESASGWSTDWAYDETDPQGSAAVLGSSHAS